MFLGVLTIHQQDKMTGLKLLGVQNPHSGDSVALTINGRQVNKILRLQVPQKDSAYYENLNTLYLMVQDYMRSTTHS
jgi:hypothetical protein